MTANWPLVALSLVAWVAAIAPPARAAKQNAPPALMVPETDTAALPVPPLPPANPPRDTPAPVPNVDLLPPTSQVQEGTRVTPTLNQGVHELPGADPVPGTQYRSDQEQRRQFIPNPGIRLIVPLEK